MREEEGLNSLSRNTIAVGEASYKSMLAKILTRAGSLQFSFWEEAWRYPALLRHLILWSFISFFSFSWVLWITAVGPVRQGIFLLLLEMPLCAHDFTWPQVITSEVLSTEGLVWGTCICSHPFNLHHRLRAQPLTRFFFLSCQTLDGRIVVRSHARVSSLTLKEIQYTDAGEYVCTASNTIGQDSQAMYLEVQCKKRRMGREGCSCV